MPTWSDEECPANCSKLKDQEKKVIHFEIAVDAKPYFSFFVSAACCLSLNKEILGKFVMVTLCLTNDSP